MMTDKKKPTKKLEKIPVKQADPKSYKDDSWIIGTVSGRKK